MMKRTNILNELNKVNPVITEETNFKTILGIKYLFPSLTIHAPANKLIDKKCNQKINNNTSLENIAYKPSKPLYRSNPSKMFPSMNKP